MPTPAIRKSLEPWIKDEVEYYEHQAQGIRHLARLKSFLLADDMGLGKSLQALTVFAIDVYRGWAQTMLIVAPVTLKGNWADEIEKFTRFPYIVLEGPPLERNKLLLDFMQIEGPKILIVNYEQVDPHLIALDSLNFDAVIFDEAHYLKNYKAKRTKACLSLYSRRSFLLTGTPMLNHVNELWSLLHRINPEQFPSYWRFVNKYAVFGGYKDKQIVGVKNEKQLTEILQSVMLRRLKSEVLNLPEVQYIERRVDLLPEQVKLYNSVVEEMRLERYDEDEPDDIENALTKFLRLKQICGTTLPFTGQDHSSKLDLAVDEAVELLENGHSVIVFTQFRDMLAAYVDRIVPFGYPVYQLHGDVKQSDRQPIVNDWSVTGPGVIVCMLQVAGVGLNMTASRHIQFLDKLFVPGLNKQAVDRAHRIGQSETQPVQVFEYLARNTIENRVNQILRTKSKLFGEIVETDPDWKRKLLIALKEA
ncbi:MAG TPA: DEAD/DEAH box helicase, partial [Candidatus Paceibacterota bacterium]